MAPNLLGKSLLYEDELTSAEPVQIVSKPVYRQHSTTTTTTTTIKTKHAKNDDTFKTEIVWRNVLIFIYLHIAALIGIYYAFTASSWKTNLFSYILALLVSQGITAGAHRLWSHKAYKAKLPLRIILCILQTISLQNHIYEWARDHRVHHKFSDTNADLHNVNRGFFFSHMGWLLCRKHPDVINNGKKIDMTDLEQDVVVMFQKKYYLILGPLFGFIIPVLIPWYYWGEDLWISWYVCGALRYLFQLHGTWLVNSAAHMFGTRPYDKNIKPVESAFVAFLSVGEGWHNYHHTFPWDYKAAELGPNMLNFTTLVINNFAKIGWAYDLKTASIDMIRKRAHRTGDGTWTFQYCNNNNETGSGFNINKNHGYLWGWDDADMKEYDKNFVEIHNRVE